MAVFVLFFVELMVMRFARFGHSHDHDVERHPGYDMCPSHSSIGRILTSPRTPDTGSVGYRDEPLNSKGTTDSPQQMSSEIPLQDSPTLDDRRPSACAGPHVPGDDHLSHAREHPHESHGKQSISAIKLKNQPN